MSGDHNMYGDGNVYRGERSKDSDVPTYTIQELAHAKGVPSMVTSAMLALQDKLAEALDKLAVLEPLTKRMALDLECLTLDPQNSRAWPKVSGVSRDEGHSRALLVFFAAEPTDDEMRAVHDTLAASPTPPAEQQAAPKAAPAERVGTIALIGNGSTTLTAAIAPVLAAPQQKAQKPVALLVRKNSWRAGQWEAAPPDSPSYGLAWANQRQYVYAAPQPAPAPLSDDTERLEWLLWKLPGDALRYVVGELADTSSGSEFRAAIDAAIAAQGGK